MIKKNSKIFVAGHKGMVGSSIIRILRKKSFKNILTIDKKKINLLDQFKTFNFLQKNKPELVIIAAARVGGIKVNSSYKASFIYENLQIQNNLIHGSYLAGVKKLIFLGSSCIYPRDCNQPIKEEYLLTGPLELTNEAYAIAKIAGLKMCDYYNHQYGTNYLCLMPCNLYGLNDNYDLDSSHFIPALIRKINYAKNNKFKEVTLWGDGSPKRELMYVDDLAKACIHFMNKDTEESLINVGSNEEYTIKQFAKKISKLIGYKGVINFDKNMPNGTPRKLLNTKILKKYKFTSFKKFDDGIKLVYQSFKKMNLN